MRIEITPPGELLAAIERIDQDHSPFIERACRYYVARLKKTRCETSDIAIINTYADRLNRGARDVIGYQKFP